ncbi:MAG: helix-turn-helix domain-containing protein [Acidimicrobiales bacterium]
MTALPALDSEVPTTSNTSNTWIPHRVAVVAIGGLLAFAPITNGTSSSAALKQVAIGYSGSDTTSGGFPKLVEVRASASAETIKDLRARSGWTWDEMAKAVGVSRRAVHAWARGARVNHAHSMRIQRLAETVNRFEGKTPGETRAALHAPSPNGLSPYELLVRSAHKISAPVMTPAEILAGEPDVRAIDDPIVEVENLD